MAAQTLPVIEAAELACSDWLALALLVKQTLCKQKGLCPPGAFCDPVLDVHMLEPTWSHFVQGCFVHQAWMWHDRQTGALQQSLLSFIHTSALVCSCVYVALKCLNFCCTE